MRKTTGCARYKEAATYRESSLQKGQEISNRENDDAESSLCREFAPEAADRQNTGVRIRHDPEDNR